MAAFSHHNHEPLGLVPGSVYVPGDASDINMYGLLLDQTTIELHPGHDHSLHFHPHPHMTVHDISLFSSSLDCTEVPLANADLDHNPPPVTPEMHLTDSSSHMVTKIMEKKKMKNIHSKVGREGKFKNREKKENIWEVPGEAYTDYVLVRARRGQATDSHSLAERVRRKKISEKMSLLQSLVPGCDKVSGKAVVLDEIINYVQSLQNQVQFLLMKLASLNSKNNDVVVGFDKDKAATETISCLEAEQPSKPDPEPEPIEFWQNNISETETIPVSTFFELQHDQRSIALFQGGEDLLWDMDYQTQIEAIQSSWKQ